MSAPIMGRAPQSSRRRRTRADIWAICDAIDRLAREHGPLTIRGLFYLLVSEGAIEKTEADYKRTVCRLAADMRRDGRLPYHLIVDHTRWQRRPRTWHGLEDMMYHSHRLYRRNLWDSQPARVEVWSEKETLSGVLSAVTDKWNVCLCCCRGYPSISFLNLAAEAILADDKPTHIAYFGDRDPSGVDIDRYVEREIRKHLDGRVEFYFRRVAVTVEQIEEFELPTRPTKGSDSRSNSFTGRSVEVDAIPPEQLRTIAEEFIGGYVDQEELARLLVIEKEERKTLSGFLQQVKRMPA